MARAVTWVGEGKLHESLERDSAPSARAISAIQLCMRRGIYHRGAEGTKVGNGFKFGAK